MNNQKRVIVFGVFDYFHPGHLFFLKKAKELGGELFVVVAQDEVVKNIKGNLPDNDIETRKRNIDKQNIAKKNN